MAVAASRSLSLLEAVLTSIQSEQSFDKVYIADATYLLEMSPFLIAVLLLAATNYQLLQDMVARCELARINHHSEH